MQVATAPLGAFGCSRYISLGDDGDLAKAGRDGGLDVRDMRHEG